MHGKLDGIISNIDKLKKEGQEFYETYKKDLSTDEESYKSLDNSVSKIKEQ